MMKILFVSLGCDKNLVDGESMLGLLRNAGYEFTDEESEADIIIVNTCCFIGDAKEESISTILEMAQWKEKGKCKVLLATGCLAERYQKEICDEIPELDGVLGTTSYDEIVYLVENALAGKKKEIFCSIDRSLDLTKERILTTGGHYAFLKIAEGCNKRCTYCVIPSVRGKYRSVPMEQLIEQAKSFAARGVKELILVAQETTVYGVDLYGRKSLPDLLRALSEIEGIHWIRIQYCYPEEITDELIQTIKTTPKVCHYIDMPIQHASDSVLKRMGRRTNQKEILERIAYIRQEIPDICLRTTLISGFPGETEEDHEILMDFVDNCEFDRLGVFPYSQEEDTPAAIMEDQVPEEVKESRREDVMELQQEIAFEKCEAMEGRVLEVFIEGKVADENAYVGRTYMDAPGVDGNVFVQTCRELYTGEFVSVIVTGALEYDLIGVLEDEFTE